ncbi:double-strand break repair helicase AddA [Palleronia abyssalis]|uniref:DNA 3'-5' helicase n=1 Tax=Palleronia abyssalis TaxID=1501240 RepID=A0A2R8BSQ6_9RHOB|nr:double-strand break repair helicase AddA [Palleronia abyssalis]SPJ23192.1 ATP-dependent helicase/nuclease subunit A [Palleronia abyssalis]
MNEASRRQIAAARPDRSTWLSANAGSGKTRVLTDRVARLLLAGVQPQNILCLTYTKAAASEMQNRLFRTLGRWAMMPDDALIDALSDLGESPGASDLPRARRLFAQAIETPGGLRIQTIHSFCAVLLRRFPLEAQVSPRFTEMDDRAAAQLRADCLEDLAQEQPDLYRRMAAICPTIDTLSAEITGARDALTEVDEDALRDAIGLAPGDRTEDLLNQVFTPGIEVLFTRVSSCMAQGTKTDQGKAPIFADLRAPFTQDDLIALESELLFGGSAKDPFGPKIGKFPGKAAREMLDAECDPLDELMERVAAARTIRLGVEVLDKSLTMNAFAHAFLARYAARKQARGWLDFDDLVLGARDLLTRKDVAEWILYRLDGGIDHILVDEAQDTSPTQWAVIQALADEFAAGHGARAPGERTIFVVGDKKQSIYSFQGADPEEFDRMHAHFDARLGPDALQRLELQHSFRSSPSVLSAVDAVFAAGLGGEVEHFAFRDTLPGRVDLWPMTEADEKTDPPAWDDPVDLPDPEGAIAKLSRQIAREIAAMIDRGETIPDKDAPGTRRPVHAGDFLILVRSRSGVFHPLIRACKAQGLDIAGADVLKLEDDLAVKDILSFLRFLALPEDDLSLAEALRSPLFGLGEGQLYDLAHGRHGYLWQRLRESDHRNVMTVIEDMQAQADFLRPFELIDRLLLRHRGREKLLGRLGMESEDAIDALLSQALAYERTDVPSLTGFLAWFDAEEVTIKRQAEGGGKRLRVMTVHGAKGLEAPIVVLADTTKKPQNDQRRLLKTEDGPVIWKPAKDARPAALDPVCAALDQAAEEERDRLLYVAMTRAENWLIVCAAGTDRPKGTWYEKITDGLSALSFQPLDSPEGAKRFSNGDWEGLELVVPETPLRDSNPALDAWFDESPPPVVEDAPLLSPSDLGGSKALPGELNPEEDPDDAMTRGTRIHLLLEHLPPDRPDEWEILTPRLLAADAVSEADLEDLLAEARGVLTAPELADLLSKPALLEVDLVASLPSGGRIAGTVDRLIVTSDHVLAVDYKSNRQVPETADGVPDGILRQMGAYAHALGQIYPGRTVETAILWTWGPRLMPLDPELVHNAFAQALA